MLFLWRHDTQHKDIKHNDTQHKDITHNDTQHKDSQNNIKNLTLSIMAFNSYAERRYAEYQRTNVILF